MLFATLVCVAWFGVCLNVLHFSGTTITHHYSISIEHKSTKSPEIGLTRHEKSRFDFERESYCHTSRHSNVASPAGHAG